MARGAPASDRPASRDMGALRALWPFLRPYRSQLLAALGALVLTALVSLALPIAVRHVVDGFSAENVAVLDGYFLLALGVAGLLAVGSAARFYLVNRLGERVISDIRKSAFARMISMSPTFYERILTGEVLSRITTDTTLIQSVIGGSVSSALRNLIMLAGGLVLLFITAAKLTLLVMLVVPLVVVPIVLLGRRLRVLARENQELIARSAGQASEQLLAAQTVQTFTHESASRDSFNTTTEAAFQSARNRVSTRAAMTAVVMFLIFAGVVCVLWIGAHDVRAGRMSVGELVQFVVLAIMVAGAAGALTEVWGELQRAAGATERLVELLETEDPVVDPVQPVSAPDLRDVPIHFDDVTFSYPARPDAPSLNQISFTIAPGETVALVGPSGAGKTTIIQMLERFYDPQSGAIRLGDTDLRDMARADFRAQMALVPQDPAIFAATARENIRFGRPTATDAEVEAAARAAAAHDFLMALPEGYDSYVGERGIMLSGGQRQRIAIARAILRDAPVLLLDEATSALDAESEAAVQKAVEQLARGRTTLIVAHRLATVKRADRILVFEQGRLVAQGTHDSLVAEGGLYARLARLQFIAADAA
ncbi:ABC transporter transmembrane domain-containing protein [Ketogulonicigenium vulgare]|uniref:ABC transporter, ATP-binding/permease protein n=1 Tax=Ketogulonicigenium vulgare (strain WSH-001) TaxID=759362 RepID=F9YA43_KETVW|nr:ABC transporter transmembrane domain-containing protein [Ketogulonicigenium vulgare]ADO43157.1 ABC transporter, ATP-binding/permease protein [Ketogulonicigenium vulgare Y25]AEM41454.1 ABC transporter, ATP-binding/permease protein [Ketogulonicigenium vulgare WSH-001]ALJ81588.1 ABC transporter [Ketogulonicigenium vulgare]ANW34267.1 ABC transporter [Ketogulonicigenium vulgare]AOZ55194.1 ABC transporter, permease/ATP-binding protein [Ketogulonicigenium vulgare]